MSSPREHQSSVRLFDLIESLPLVPGGVGVLGEATDGKPLLLNLLVPETAHVLVSGEHAVGKTLLMRALATSLALLSRQAELQMVLIDTDLAGGNDPQGSLQPVSYLPHCLTEMVVTVEDATAVLRFLLEEMAYRLAQGINRPQIAIFIDHLLPLVVEGGVAVEEALQTLLQKGAEAGMHLIVAMRGSEAPALSTLLEENWPVRLLGSSIEGVEGDGTGEFLAYMAAETEVGFQPAQIDDYDLQTCLEDFRRYRAPTLLARPLSP